MVSRKKVSYDFGIDLGTNNIHVYFYDKDILVNSKAILNINGNKIQPMRDGVIYNMDYAVLMLKQIFKKCKT